MAVYIQTVTDAFAETRAAARTGAGNYANIRRPLRGIQVKPNTYAQIRVLTAGGDPIRLFDSGSKEHSGGIGYSERYANFLIQRLSETRAEKQQIVETFGEDYVYFFGERPRFLDVSGVLINTADFNWKSEFWANYDAHLRGTKLVEKNARLYFYFDDVVVEGYLLGASSSADSQQPHLLPFQFQIFITNYAILSSVGSVFIAPSDTGGYAGRGLEPIPPSTTAAALAGGLELGGGLNAFLASASNFANDATFSIQSTLENLRNALYARPLIVPDGIGTMSNSIQVAPQIDNLAAFEEAPTGVPIWDMSDEYVERTPKGLTGTAAIASKAEMARVEALLKAQDPMVMEARARAEFEAAGIDTGKPSAMMAILGRGAFAAVQYAAPFALAKVSGGKIGVADQAISSVL